MSHVNKVESGYQSYLESGGIINEMDYQSAIDRMSGICRIIMSENSRPIQSMIEQVEGVAEYSRIELRSSEHIPDQRVVLYVVLRGDTNSKGVKYHHDQMSDQRIFGEGLRRLGDIDSFNKLVKAYPH